MAEDPTGPSELHRLHATTEAELERALVGQDLPGEDEEELEQYLVRLRDLREAVVEMETYEDELGEI